MEPKQIDHSAYQRRVRGLSTFALHYIIADCHAAIEAMPNGEKAGYYADESSYCSMELERRRGVK